MHKVNNAIILAAGRGSRLKHLTDNTPKPLLSPNGEKFIEGIIYKLKEKGINDIYVVTGYKSEQFDYLKDKNIKLIHNAEWELGNNVTSIKAAIDVLSNSLIVNGDIILEKNFFETEYPHSLTYVETNENIDEWLTIVNEEGNVIDFEKNGLGKKGLYQREIIFITKTLAEGIKDDIKNFDMQEYQEFLMLKSAKRLSIPFGTYKVPKESIYDLDTIEEFENYKKTKKAK